MTQSQKWYCVVCKLSKTSNEKNGKRYIFYKQNVGFVVVFWLFVVWLFFLFDQCTYSGPITSLLLQEGKEPGWSSILLGDGASLRKTPTCESESCSCI